MDLAETGQDHRYSESPGLSVYSQQELVAQLPVMPPTSLTATKWKQADGYNSPDKEILIRLADIILLKAEAFNNTSQTAQASPLINQIRAGRFSIHSAIPRR